MQNPEHSPRALSATEGQLPWHKLCASPLDVTGAPRGLRESVGSRGDRAMPFSPCPGKQMTETSLFLRQGSPHQQRALGAVLLGSKIRAR